jgi:hypothetical protein
MRHEVYRVAYDEAHAELTEILGKFEQLRIRKDKIEKVVEALKPLLSSGDFQVNGMDRVPVPAERKPAPVEAETVQAVSSPIPYPVQQAIEPANDPFSRRADSAARDLQEYSRLFNTSLSRGN